MDLGYTDLGYTDLGYTKVRNLGGFKAWVDSGLPAECA